MRSALGQVRVYAHVYMCLRASVSRFFAIRALNYVREVGKESEKSRFAGESRKMDEQFESNNVPERERSTTA